MLNLSSSSHESSFKKRKNQKGLAIFELIPTIIILVMLIQYTYGIWGAVHTAILNSIASRNYAFATFLNRSNLTVLRPNSTQNISYNYSKEGVRFHGIKAEDAADNKWRATVRPLVLNPQAVNLDPSGTQLLHTKSIFSIKPNSRYEGEGVSPIWIQVRYGMCLNRECGQK